MIPVLIGISLVNFALIYLAPGNPFLAMLPPDVPAEDRENMLQAIGYYDPLPLKYVKWASRAVQGDLGYSIKYSRPVTEVIAARMGNTFSLSIAALLLSVCIAVPLGIISATRQYSVYDYAVTIIALIGISLPSFFMALGLVKIISMDLALLPISGMEDYLQGYTGINRFVDIIRHMALPVIVLTLAQTASTMRYTRSAMLEVIQQDYIRTARAKGLKEKVVIYTHAFRNAMIPVVTIVSTSLGFIFSGAILIEMVFAWPGMGTLMYQAISNRDYPVVMGCTMILGVFVLMANTLADILYAVVDPRIRFS